MTMMALESNIWNYGVVGDQSDEVVGSIAVVEVENRKQHLLNAVW